MKFIDIHSHILPGIDDGVREITEALLIMNDAVEIGVKEIIFTPHFPYNGVEFGKILNKFESFREAVSRSGMNITLHLGTELMVSPELPKLIKDDKRLTINGKGKYVLIEAPTFEIPIYVPGVLFSLLAQGVTPIWAHPERCFEIIKDYRIVNDFVNNGGILQINAGSVLGKYGKTVRSAAIALIKEGLCQVVASDTHRSGEISKLLPDAFLYLEKTVGNARAFDMFYSSPSKLVCS